MKKIIKLTVLLGDGTTDYSVGFPASLYSKIEERICGKYSIYNLKRELVAHVINCPVIVTYEP